MLQMSSATLDNLNAASANYRVSFKLEQHVRQSCQVCAFTPRAVPERERERENDYLTLVQDFAHQALLDRLLWCSALRNEACPTSELSTGNKTITQRSGHIQLSPLASCLLLPSGLLALVV